MSYWARQAGLKSPDDAELVQDVFTVLVQKLPEFNYDSQQSFRGWMRTIILNRWRDRQRRMQVLPAEAGRYDRENV